MKFHIQLCKSNSGFLQVLHPAVYHNKDRRRFQACIVTAEHARALHVAIQINVTVWWFSKNHARLYNIAIVLCLPKGSSVHSCGGMTLQASQGLPSGLFSSWSLSKASGGRNWAFKISVKYILSVVAQIRSWWKRRKIVREKSLESLMWRIYVTKPMSDSWDWYNIMSLIPWVTHGNELRLFSVISILRS